MPDVSRETMDAERLAKLAYAVSLDVTGGFVWEALPKAAREKWIESAQGVLMTEAA